jgi:DNA polymerase III subunit delta'
MPIKGHDAQFNAVLSAARGTKMHHAWLLTGPKGLGKACFAATVAARVLAEASAQRPADDGVNLTDDHPTAKLIAAGSHPDLITLARLPNEKTGDLARNINVEQVRHLGNKFQFTPSQSERRVVIIDAADDMERSAANALLKNLEEPPAHTLFLLVSHVPGRLLPTIRSRCSILRFSALSDDVMASVIREHLPDSTEAEVTSLVAAGLGIPGRALELAGLNIAEMDDVLARLAATGDPMNVDRVHLSQQLSLKAAQPRYAAFLARVPKFIAQAARGRSGPELSVAIAQWEAAQRLAGSAVQLSLDPQSTVFALTGYVAALAPSAEGAKA